ncbi:hypothetical protein [Pacificoceanicola onchidii]|uniref:hypothetical protein n=1 Tax=Pacificoceanicola onchidii TaxID=2562685 RepID=UPI0010A34B16|nr:hypothetical protein [Pacificoceanicola onchidii]
MAWGVEPDMMQAFHIDGSLRDNYVFEATEADWARLVEALRAQGAGYFRKGEKRPFPKDCTDLFRGDAQHLFRIDLNGIAVNCHAFTVGEIELDVAPDDVSTPAQASQVLAFMADIGEALGKPVVLTEENGRHHVWFRYDPVRALMTYGLDGRQVVWTGGY